MSHAVEELEGKHRRMVWVIFKQSNIHYATDLRYAHRISASLQAYIKSYGW